MKIKLPLLLSILVAIYFLTKCVDGFTVNQLESTFVLGLFSLLILKLNKFDDVKGAWIWGREHWIFGGFLLFSYIAMLGQLIFHFFNGRLRVVDVLTMEIQAILFFSACFSLGFWLKEKISVLLKRK